MYYIYIKNSIEILLQKKKKKNLSKPNMKCICMSEKKSKKKKNCP